MANQKLNRNAQTLGAGGMQVLSVLYMIRILLIEEGSEIPAHYISAKAPAMRHPAL